jgi:general secretion pathway protein F
MSQRDERTMLGTVFPPQSLRWHSSTLIPGSSLFEHRVSFLALLHGCIRDSIPLVPMVRALALEYPGDYSYILGKFSRLIERGVPWIDALEQTPGALSSDTVAALRLGHQSDLLMPMFEQLRRDELDRSLNRERSYWRDYLAYWFAVAFVILNSLSAVSYFIVPTFIKMMEEFEVQGPVHANFVLAFTQAVYPPLIVLATVALLTLVGWSHAIRYGIRKLFRIPDANISTVRANVIRMLATITEHGRPINQALTTLAEHGTNGYLRNRLSDACTRLERGVAPFEALQSAGLISRSQCLALQDESASNQAWILRKIASSLLVKEQFRGQWVQSLVSPAIALFLAISVFGVASALLDSIYGIVLKVANDIQG